MADEQSNKGGVCSCAPTTEYRIPERELEVSGCHIAQMREMGGQNGPILGEKVLPPFL